MIAIAPQNPKTVADCVTVDFGGCGKASAGRGQYLVVRDSANTAHLYCLRTFRKIRLDLDAWDWLEIGTPERSRHH